jgi:pyrroline-5-carboxylate reductase
LSFSPSSHRRCWPAPFSTSTLSLCLSPPTSSQQVVQSSDIVFIAVKPQYVSTVLAEIRPVLADRHVLVSIAAGVTIAALKVRCFPSLFFFSTSLSLLSPVPLCMLRPPCPFTQGKENKPSQEAAGPTARLVRVMPNTPCLVGESAAAMCVGGAADAADADGVRTLLSAVGVVHAVDEKLLSAVTGLSGSGPAYVFLIIEALADGGVRAGLPRDVSQALAAQTVLGGARMVLDTGRHPGALKDMVTSPAGTTIAGVHALERGGVRAALIDAVMAATARADELARLN